jgi:hypothetical protein
MQNPISVSVTARNCEHSASDKLQDTSGNRFNGTQTIGSMKFCNNDRNFKGELQNNEIKTRHNSEMKSYSVITRRILYFASFDFHWCQTLQIILGFQLLTAGSMKIRTFFDTAPCSSVGEDRRFRAAYCFLPQGDDGGKTHLWNVGLLKRDYTALYQRRLSSSVQLIVHIIEIIC